MNEHSNFDKTTLVLPILIISVGIGWLLTALGVAPHIDWIWTISLGMIGILTFIMSGLDKFSVVVGPFFLCSSFMSILRQRQMITMDVEVPCLVIILGVFLAIAQLPAIRTPSWLSENKGS